MSDFTGLYYNPNKMLSYNRILNFVVGARGVGKTFSMKKQAIRNFIKKDKQFVFIRRHKSDFNKFKQFFNGVQDHFPTHEFTVDGYNIKIDGDVAGWGIPLSTWQKQKGNEFPNVTLIIYDEFLKEKDNSYYLPNEPNALLNLMDTIMRNRTDCRCVCLSNAVSIVNPFFVYFDIVPDKSKRYNAYSDILVEFPDSLDFIEERKQTPFGRLVKDTDYADMAMGNEFVNDSDVFIEPKTKYAKHKFIVVFQGLEMGLWVDVQEGLMFLSQDYDPYCRYRYALQSSDLTYNMMLLDNWKQNYHLYKLVKAFKSGYLRFENQVIRTTAYEMFKKMNIE